MIGEQSNNSRLIVLFDGNCILCNSSARFLKRNIVVTNIDLIPSNSEEGKFLVFTHQLENIFNESIVLIKQDIVFLKSDAILELVNYLKPKYKLLSVFRVFPRNIRNLIYDLVSRNRHKLYQSNQGNKIE